MIKSPRGPFKRIRWFCNDGTVLPPKPYACEEHGGGVQHGEWNDQIKILRDNGYYVANILADLKPSDFFDQENHQVILKQVLLEQFLAKADDGWIFRGARHYRGALQAENESEKGRDLLLSMLEKQKILDDKYIVLYETARLLPHGRQGAPLIEMRQLSKSIAEIDPGFESLRVKIHVQPNEKDADRVRTYGIANGRAELADKYKLLADIIQKVYRPRNIDSELFHLADKIKSRNLAQTLRTIGADLSEKKELSIRVAAANQLLAVIRSKLKLVDNPTLMLPLLDLSMDLEREVFQLNTQLQNLINSATRRQRLVWLKESAAGIYGLGFISSRQWKGLEESFLTILNDDIDLKTYKIELAYLSRVSQWADRMLQYHFSEAIDKFSRIEPLAQNYIHDRLHGSPLLFYADVLDSLIADANSLIGMRHQLFGSTIAGGLKGLNPGLARGILKFPEHNEDLESIDRMGIYVLPSTVSDLPPVAGIITTDSGNSLSHVQLLARNLGIPNVTADKKLIPQLKKMINRHIVLAVSNSGLVRIGVDNTEWDTIFHNEEAPETLIRPDMKKLNLETKKFLSLKLLRASDSGRIAGPKAANLGELKFHFPDAVADGLVIPFGAFRELLEIPFKNDGKTMFSWIKENYRTIRNMNGLPEEKQDATKQFLKQVRDWIMTVDIDGDFRSQLHEAMQKNFGTESSYGVFVRSDTNVEDLPGFTGAGLNRTVPNVTSFEAVLNAIRRVWASPFEDRAYEWRQAYMENPEHLYVSVLLMKSVPVEKSGVMVTVNIQNGMDGWLSVAANEGVGGAVEGQTAEELRINQKTGKVRLLAQATEPNKRMLQSEGGIITVPTSNSNEILNQEEIQKLVTLSKTLPHQFPMPRNEDGRLLPADIEFGFVNGQLALFQIRPFVESKRARQSLFLASLDSKLKGTEKTIDLEGIPAKETQ